jgi:hypothetical protein
MMIIGTNAALFLMSYLHISQSVADDYRAAPATMGIAGGDSVMVVVLGFFCRRFR